MVPFPFQTSVTMAMSSQRRLHLAVDGAISISDMCNDGVEQTATITSCCKLKIIVIISIIINIITMPPCVAMWLQVSPSVFPFRLSTLRPQWDPMDPYGCSALIAPSGAKQRQIGPNRSRSRFSYISMVSGSSVILVST